MILLSDRDGERADALLARLVPELSRSQAQRLLELTGMNHNKASPGRKCSAR